MNKPNWEASDHMDGRSTCPAMCLKAMTLVTALALAGPASASPCDIAYHALNQLDDAGRRLLASGKAYAAAAAASEVPDDFAATAALYSRYIAAYRAAVHSALDAFLVLPRHPPRAAGRVRAARIKRDRMEARAAKLRERLPEYAIEPIRLEHNGTIEWLGTQYLASCYG